MVMAIFVLHVSQFDGEHTSCLPYLKKNEYYTCGCMLRLTEILDMGHKGGL